MGYYAISRSLGGIPGHRNKVGRISALPWPSARPHPIAKMETASGQAAGPLKTGMRSRTTAPFAPPHVQGLHPPGHLTSSQLVKSNGAKLLLYNGKRNLPNLKRNKLSTFASLAFAAETVTSCVWIGNKYKKKKSSL